MLNVNDFISSYRQDRHKISTVATCLWDQRTSIFKLNTVPCYWKSEHKMAAIQTRNTYISACTLDRKKHSKSKMYVFDHGLLNGDTLNPVPCYRKSEHKMAAAQAGNTYISACTLDKNTIPNTKPMFSATGFSMVILINGETNAPKFADPRLVAVSPYFKSSILHIYIKTIF